MSVTSAPARSVPERWRRLAAALLLAASVAWGVALWWAPRALAGPAGQPLWPVAATAVYLMGRTVCHQQPERSFVLGHVPQPVCARCSGLYLGAPLGLAVGMAMARRGRRRASARVAHGTMRRILVWAAAPTLASVAVEWLELIQPGNAGRFLLAVPAGAAVAWVTAAALLTPIDDPVE